MLVIVRRGPGPRLGLGVLVDDRGEAGALAIGSVALGLGVTVTPQRCRNISVPTLGAWDEAAYPKNLGFRTLDESRIMSE